MHRSLRLAVVTATLAAAGVGATAVPAEAFAAGLPSITAVRFAGPSGSGQPSPTLTITGSGFGAAPSGTDNDVTSCGTYTANGDAYGSALYFTDNNKFTAGYSDAGGAACIGIVVRSWTDRRIVLSFGNAYGTFTNWFLANGDGYAVSVKQAIFGGRVSRLS